MEGLDVLPVLLQQGDEEVHGEVDVLGQLVLRHLHIAHGHVEAEHLLHLELDGGLEVDHLGVEVVRVGDEGGELAGLVESWAQKPRDLLDQGVGAEESVVLLGEALHLLLVLVELLEVVGGHGLEALLLGLVTVSLVAQHAHVELLAGHELEPEGGGGERYG